jgi:hypothetical protein
MKKAWPLISSFILFTLLLSFSGLYAADDPNEVAYQNRFSLKSGTILNSEGKGDSLIFPYYDVRTIDGRHQVTQIQIENIGEYGIAAKLRVNGWLRGREVFSKDIWIPSSSVWTGTIEINEDATNALLTSSDNVIVSYDPNSFSLSSPLSSGSPFSKKYIRKNNGDSTLYGYIEVIGAEKTSPDNIGGNVGRLAKSERDCPNTLKGSASINRVEDGVSMVYDAVAIGNFSRGQGSLFRSTRSTFPHLDTCEDSLDQFEFQLSKCEIRGSYSLDPSTQSRTSIIVTFPTKHLHYRNGSRIKQVDNPFEAPRETGAEFFGVTLSEEGQNLTESEIDLPFSVNVIGLYREDSGSLSGIDNLPLVTDASELGEAILTSYNFAYKYLIPDFENYFGPSQGRFMMYKGLPAVGLVLQESRDAGQPSATFTPVDYSRCMTPSNVEVILSPAVPSGPTFGIAGTSYTFTASGASSSLGHPIQYQFDWVGDGKTDLSAWGSATQSKTWTTGGDFIVRARARCTIHTSIVSKWSDGLAVTIESVSAPTLLSGPTEGIPDQSYNYTASGAFSTAGHALQYQFDWGDGTTSEWGPATQSKIWTVGGPYNIKARARCATHTTVVSDWTSELTVTIEIVSVPSTPVGPNLGDLGASYSFSTGGSTSNLGHLVEYQFDWGDGTFSPWGSSTQSKSWSILGTFLIKARARCVTDTSVMSDWSSGLTFDIEVISNPSPPTGPINGIKGIPYSYTAGGAVSSSGHTLQYQFDWNGDGVTDLSLWGGASRTKTWTTSGMYIVKVRARCSIHQTLVTGWSSGLVVVIEFVNPPTMPTGPTIGTVGQIYAYVVGGASSDRGDAIQYQFDWGDGTNSGWLSVGVVSVGKTWANPGTYTVKAQARCSIHTNVTSEWSAGRTVTISAPPPPAELVSAPITPLGPNLGNLSTVYSFTTGGSISTLGHSVQYQFDWGDGTFSQWGSSTQSRSWSSYGAFVIKARARCVTDIGVMSDWSSGLTFVIELITVPSQPFGPLAVMRGQPNTYIASGAVSNVNDPLEYQFDWKGDGTTDLSAWIAATVDPITFVTQATAQKIWINSGTYTVRARVRCSTHQTLVSLWSSGLVVVVEFVNPPTKPSGPSSGTVGEGYSYTTGGSSSDRGDPVQYRFNWGHGTTPEWSEWLPVGVASVGNTWTSPGTYAVRAEARCAVHNIVISDWSMVLTVTINPGPPPLSETISTPWIDAPGRSDPPSTTNAIEGVPGTTYTYTAKGGASNLGHTVEYQFNWGDGTSSPWGGASQIKAWATSSKYDVTVTARCTQHPTVVSATSYVYNVAIEYISPPSAPTGPSIGAVGVPNSYSATGATSAFVDPVQYRFHWGDGNDSGWQPVGTVTADHTWAFPGEYTVWVEARSATYIGAVSVPSGSISVTITPP